MTPSTFTFPVVSFRHLDTPFDKVGYRDYFAVADTAHLPDFSDWRKINVRDPKLTGAVPKAIRTSFQEKPDRFVFLNRGLVLAVDSVKFDNKAMTVTAKLTDPKLHGLLDGGHTYNIVMEETPDLQEPQYIRIEFLEGFDHEDITDVVDARNTSNQVRDQSLMNLAGRFEELKNALRDAPFLDHIAFKEYEVDSAGNPKPIDVREVIAILTTFDKDHFTESVHPIMSYNSKAACLKHFADNPESYWKIYPLATEILLLCDHVRDQLPILYNKARGGKFGGLKGVSYHDGKKKPRLNFLRKDTKYGVPDGFVYPLLGGFRALLEERKGVYVWGKGLDPVDLLKEGLGLKLADTMGTFALETQNPSKTGKTALVWQNCYQSVQVAYLQTK